MINTIDLVRESVLPKDRLLFYLYVDFSFAHHLYKMRICDKI